MADDTIPLSDIDADLEWNSRSAANVRMLTVSETDEESTGLEGLMKSLLTAGQDTPVDVRPTAPPFYKVTGKPWSLVAGFRRFTALSVLNADADLLKESAKSGKPIVPGLINGTIRATLHPAMTEFEAFRLNARENTVRDSLTPPDTLGVVIKGLTAHKMTVPQMAILLGKSPAVIKNYERVAKLPPAMLSHWRFGGEYEGVRANKRVGFTEMTDIARRPTAEREEAYKHALLHQIKKIDSNVWLEKAKHRAVAVGTLLAKLQKAGMLSVHTPQGWIAHVDSLVRTGKRELKFVDARKLAASAEQSYAREMAKPLEPAPREPAVDAEGEETTPEFDS